MSAETLSNYKRHEKKSEDPESVWHYFLVEVPSRQTAKCLTCAKILKTHSGSTGGLLTHLEKHKIYLRKKASESVSTLHIGTDASTSSGSTNVSGCHPPTKSASVAESGQHNGKANEPPRKKVKISEYMVHAGENSLEAAVSRMTARDGFPFSVFCTSGDLRAGLFARGFVNLPKSPNTVRALVMRYADKVRQVVISELNSARNSGTKFSLTFDEWTSGANKRYMNVNVHGGDDKFWSLGLIRVSGTMPAVKCIQLVKHKLDEHGLSLQFDIVAITTDGASLMTKVGKSIAALHQLCYAHGIQLGVLDVLYKNRNQTDDTSDTTIAEHDAESSLRETRANKTHSSTSSNETTTVDETSDFEGLELSMDVEEIDETGGMCVLDDEVDNDLFLQVFPDKPNLESLIRKVRKVVCMFRKSPTRNDDFLQKYVRDEFGKELPLMLDTKTRWSSLFLMLERFHLVRNAVRKALIDLKLQSPITLTEDDFLQIDNIVHCLEVVKLTVEVLCRRDSNLLTADAALQFMMKKLREQNSDLGTELADALSKRIHQRRSSLSGVMLYLQNPTVVESDEVDRNLFSIPTSAEIRKVIKELVERLHNSHDAADDSVDVSGSVDSSAEGQEANEVVQTPTAAKTKKISVQEELAMAIRSSTSTPLITTSRNQELHKVIRQEMTLFENTGTRGRYLQMAYDYLKTVPPTSVEAERAFSAAGVLCSRLRTRLGDTTLDTLCFLRSYFQKFN